MPRAALTSDEFNDHAMRIVNTATADGILATDGISATCKALGVLVAVAAKREGVSFEDLLKFAVEAVSDFAKNSR